MFAKIHDSDVLGQILVTKEWDSTEESSNVVIAFEHQEMMFRMAIGTKTPEAQEEVFQAMDLARSEATIKEAMPIDIFEAKPDPVIKSSNLPKSHGG